MTLGLALAVPLAVACVATGLFLVNEWSHGAVAEAAGLGHHHLLAEGDPCPVGAGTPHEAMDAADDACREGPP